MKKVIGILAIVALLVGVMAVAAASASSPGDGVPDYVGDQPGNAWGFVDEDGDGVSDRFVDEDGDGICDRFVDEDGDGINDLRGTIGSGFGYGRQGAGRCSGDNFVDEDGDGVCDNAGGGLRLGRGMRHGQNR